MEAIQKFHAPMDLMFQSIAGSQKGNEAFGISGTMLKEGYDMMMREGTSTGPNVMYFETGQGSELSSEAHHGWDQVTMEARCYGFAKISPVPGKHGSRFYRSGIPLQFKTGDPSRTGRSLHGKIKWNFHGL